ncbi:dephospho-CoA kinase [Pseudohyphozyma bogoriensis]|nr:dephospho-CoA kinase [Pseudohyphozyma bogoriensis]
MLIVGLTGGIASGKSTVSEQLKLPPHSVPLIDLDVLSRRAVAPGTSALASLVKQFGTSILRSDGSLDRDALGSIVFENGDDRARKELNRIVHPAVRRLLLWELAKLWLSGEKLVVVDAPLLIEAGLWKFCGAIIVVYCSETLQLQRLMARNTLTLAAAQSRLASQSPLSSKLVFADYVIDNSGPQSALAPQVSLVVKKLRARVGWSWWLSWLLPPFGLLKGSACVGWRLGFKGVGRARREKYASRGERRTRAKEPEEIELVTRP